MSADRKRPGSSQPTDRSGDASTPPQAKKLRDGLIDDPVAREIFKELNVSEDFFNSGKVLSWALSPTDEAFIDIHDYVERSQEHGYGIRILTVLRVMSKAQDYLEFNDNPEHEGKRRMMLWHGTKSYAIAPILENGLKIPRHGGGLMFGSGVYTADRISKSANYCDRSIPPQKASTAQTSRWSLWSSPPPPPNPVGYLFLCDVLLGKSFERTEHNHKLTAAPAGHDSVKGLGVYVPDPTWDKEVEGSIWPLGPTVDYRKLHKNGTQKRQRRILNYNEYIVYDGNQIQPKFLVKVEFTPKPVHETVC